MSAKYEYRCEECGRLFISEDELSGRVVCTAIPHRFWAPEEEPTSTPLTTIDPAFKQMGFLER